MKKRKYSRKFLRGILIIAGSVSLALGAVGVALPLLPSFPFFCITLVCYAKSSQKLYNWFVSTKMYRNHLYPISKKQPVCLKTKIAMLSSITLLMGFGVYMMRNIPVGQAVLTVVWLIHMFLLALRIKTFKHKNNPSNVTKSNS